MRIQVRIKVSISILRLKIAFGKNFDENSLYQYMVFSMET